MPNSDLYQIALTHSSCTKDDSNCENNERLEFFGDAVLKLVFSKYLYNRYPDSPEGIMTEYRSKLISDKLLSEIAFAIELDKKIKVGSSLSAKKTPASVAGDALEAYIGATYIDQGYEAAEKFVLDNWEPFIEDAIQASTEENYKAILQDKIQKEYNEAPTYKTLEASGPDHHKKFRMGVYFRDELIAEGTGNSKKTASQDAAKNAIPKWKKSHN